MNKYIIEDQPLPEKVVEKIIKDSDMKVSRNRSFYLSAFLSAMLVFMSYKNATLADKFSTVEAQTILVKMSIDGTWTVEFPDGKATDEYPISVVESVLSKYAKYKYSKSPETMQLYYGYIAHMMSQEHFTEFTDEKGWNAKLKIEEILGCNACETIEIKTQDQFIFNEYEHQEKNQKAKLVYQTHLYVNEIKKDSQGIIISKLKKIVSITWRIRTKKEQNDYAKQFIKNKQKDQLREIMLENPIGLQVISDEMIDIK